jgi:hypothetical protein
MFIPDQFKLYTYLQNLPNRAITLGFTEYLMSELVRSNRKTYRDPKTAINEEYLKLCPDSSQGPILKRWNMLAS